MNNVSLEDRPVHDWYRFVLSFPPHLVRDYLTKFNATEHDRILDPFCGTGTTLVECKKMGIPSVGIEANDVTYYASSIKVDWTVEPDALNDHAAMIVNEVRNELMAQGINDDANLQAPETNHHWKTFSDDEWKVMLKNAVSPLPLHKLLTLQASIERHSNENNFLNHERLALAKAAVSPISNMRFGPEASIGKIKTDHPVLLPWLNNIRAMTRDLREVYENANVPADLFHADARRVGELLPPNSIDIVITSPPYPNEKDYTRITRLESVLLGFIRNKSELKALKKNLIRSNTRNVYVGDADDDWITHYGAIQEIADEIEARRIALNKDSGFEKLYGRVTKLYFGGMARHLSNLTRVLRPGARLAYVVGDQASYLRIMIRTGQLLAQIAEEIGYEVIDIELFRTRAATATKDQLREEIVVLRWNG